MADDAASQTPDIYEAGPPKWLLKTSRIAELGDSYSPYMSMLYIYD